MNSCFGRDAIERLPIESLYCFIVVVQNTTAKNIPWQITSKSLQDEKIKVGTVEGNSIGSYVYTGNAIKPVPTVTYDNTVSLVNGVDFTLSYANNINVGTATITITGKGNYQGTIQVTFQITKATMQVDASDYTGVFDNKSHTISVKATKALPLPKEWSYTHPEPNSTKPEKQR